MNKKKNNTTSQILENDPDYQNALRKEKEKQKFKEKRQYN